MKDIAEGLFVDATVRDEGLAAAQHVVVALPGSGRAHGKHIGARARLRHAQATDPLASDGLGEDASALLFVAVHGEVLGEEDAVGEQRQRETRIGGRQDLRKLDRGNCVETRPPVGLRNRDAQQIEFCRALEESVVEGFGSIVLRGLGLHLALDELAQHTREESVLFPRRGEIEVSQEVPEVLEG